MKIYMLHKNTGEVEIYTSNHICIGTLHENDNTLCLNTNSLRLANLNVVLDTTSVQTCESPLRRSNKAWQVAGFDETIASSKEHTYTVDEQT